ncbi:MAG TPA: hypothetical protein VGJ19_04985 [Streptosporangiaceae bacterium]
MIRFSASLVVVGVGLLIAGGVTSRLLLIYIAIGVSALALLFLIVGAILHRAELFGREPEGIAGGQAGHEGYADELGAKPEPPATVMAAAPAPDDPARRGSADLSPAQQAFAGYEQFTRQASRRRPEPSREDQPSRPSRPSQPQAKPPFVEPEPTRMDWAADLREAEKQERERQGQAPQRPARPGVPAQAKPERAQPSQTRPGQSRPGQDRPGQGQPDRGRPDRGQPGKPFVDPQPTRMDWAAGLREAEQQELGRQARDKDREATGREPGGPGGREPAGPDGREAAGPGSSSRPGGPQRTPEPTRAEATRAEKVQRPAEATRAEKVQTPRAEPAPAQATRAEKIIPAKPDGKAPGEDQPAGTPAATPETTAKAEAKVGEKPSPAQTEAKPGTPPAKEAQEPAEAAEETKSPAADSDTAKPGTPETGTSKPGTPETGTSKPSPPSASAAAAKTGDTGHDNGHDDPVTDDQNVTVVPGVPRYHRSECILIRFMGDNDLQRMPVEQAREAGCTPCRACQPDGEEDG